MYFLILFACLGAITSARGGSIVFSDLIGGNPAVGPTAFNICGVQSGCFDTESGAVQFVPDGDFALLDAQVFVGNFALDGNFQSGPIDEFNVFLAEDSGALPGSVIEQIGFDLQASGAGGIAIADSIATPILLISGTPYWLVLTPATSGTSVAWKLASSSLLTAENHTAGGLSGWFSTGAGGGQMEIDGNLIPEPATLSLVVFGMSLLVYGRIARRKRQESRCVKISSDAN
jgi:hypothetical protein